MKVVIIGAGGHGRVVLDTLQELDVEVVGFIDDRTDLQGRQVDEVAVIGDISHHGTLRSQQISIALGIGDNGVRARFYTQVKNMGLRVFSPLHPKAVISKRSEIGEGVVVMGGVVINTGVKIGNNVCVNTGSTIDHDNLLEDHVHIAPGANVAGGVEIGEGTLVGVGTSIIPNCKVGCWSIVAAGSVVTQDIPDRVTVAGQPARVIKVR